MNHLLAVGLNMADIYVDEKIMYPGGNEVNVAVYARRLGFSSGFMGVFGSDEMAGNIESVLNKGNVDISNCRYVSGDTGIAVVRLVNGERTFSGGNNGGVTGSEPIRIKPEDIPYIQNYDVITTSRYGRLPVEEVINLCKIGRPVAYDFSAEEPELLEQIGRHLTYAVFSCADKDLPAAKDLLERSYSLGCPYSIATLGSEGSILYDGKEWYFQPAIPANVIDTMGAGDSFITAFLLYHRKMLPQKSHAEAIRFAMKAGASFASETCEKKGAIGYEFPIDPSPFLTE